MSFSLSLRIGRWEIEIGDHPYGEGVATWARRYARVRHWTWLTFPKARIP